MNCLAQTPQYAPQVLAGSGGQRQRGRRRPGPPKRYGAYPWYSTWLIEEGPYTLFHATGEKETLEGPAVIVLPPYVDGMLELPVVTRFSWVEWGPMALERIPRYGPGGYRYQEDLGQPPPEEVWGIPLPLHLPEELWKPTRKMIANVTANWWRPYPFSLLADAEISLWIAKVIQYHSGTQPSRGLFSSASAEFQEYLSQLENGLAMSATTGAWADSVSLTAQTLSRRCRKETGLSAKAVIEVVRMQRAEELLRNQTNPVSDVASHCGFQTREAFSHWFTRKVGTPPAQWRMQHP